MALKRIQYKQHSVNISYEIVNPHAKRDMVVLHGWGVHKELMKDAFSKSLDTFRHVYIDLPGFGNSSCAISMDTHDYRAVIARFLEELSIRRDIIVGHSFGGKIATLLRPDLLVLLSSAGIKEPKPFKVWLKIYTFKLLKHLGLSALRKKFVASDAKQLDKHMYETFKNVVNEDFSPVFRHYTGKALVLWGEDDTATHLSSGRRIHALIENSRLEVFSGDHYFFLHHIDEISKSIENAFISQEME